MTKLSESIIGKIKKEKICPTPRWHFLLKNYFLWLLFALCVLVGSFSFSVIANMLSNGDFDMFHYLNGSILTSAVLMLPYFWLLLLIVFAFVALYNWRRTRLGYRFRRRWMLMSSILMSVILGGAFYEVGLGDGVDALMGRSLPLYDLSKHSARREIWMQPEKGLIMGKIVDVDDQDDLITVSDEKGQKWKVSEKGAKWKIKLKNKLEDKKGKIVKIIGERKGEDEFEAKEIRRCGDCQDDEDRD